MTSYKNKVIKNSSQFFTSTSQNSMPYRAWFSILSISSKPNAYYLDIFLSFVEYLQLITQAFLTNDSLYNQLPVTPPLITTIFAICSTVNPSYFMVFSPDSESYILKVFICLLCYSILKYTLLVYMIILAFKRKFCAKPVLTLWRWNFKLQGRVTYHLISWTWVRLFLAAYEHQVTLDTGLNMIIMLISGGFYVTEFLFSMIVLTQFTYPIPNKSFLTSKHQYTETITLVQKFCGQALRIAFSGYPMTASLVRNISGFSFSMLRNLFYLTTFPHYRQEAALYVSSLMMFITSLFASYLLYFILKSVYDENLNIYFSLVMTVLFTVLSIRLCRAYVRRVWLDITLKDYDNRKDFLIHRIIAVKVTTKRSINLTQIPDRYSFSYLTGVTKSAWFKSKLSLDINSKEELKKGLLGFLRYGLPVKSSDDIVKLYKAYYFGHQFKLYGLAVKILQEVEKSTSAINAASAHILRYSLQNNLIFENRNGITKLDLYSYVTNINFVSELKRDILKQAEYQVDLYENFCKISQDLNKTYELGQKVNHHRQKVENKIQYLLEAIPGYYIEPLMICAHYYFVLNHAPHRYQHYIQMYTKKSTRYKNLLDKDDICQENLYQRSSHLTVLSSNKRELGTVKYMTEGARKLYGKDIVNNHFCAILHEEFRDIGYKVTQEFLEVVDQALYDQQMPTISYNFSGKFYTQCNQYYNMNPILYQGLYILFFVRITSNSQPFIIVRDNGNIIGFTQQIGQNLGLFERQNKFSKEININLLSDKLARVNQAFNMIASPEKYSNTLNQNLDFEEAKNLYDAFSSTGEEIQLRHLGHRDKDRYYSYHCKFGINFYGGTFVRTIMLKSTSEIEFSIGTTNEFSIEQFEIEPKTPLKKHKEDESEGSIASEDIIRALPDGEEIRNSPLFREKNVTENPIKQLDFQIDLQSTEKKDTNIFTTEQDNLTQRNLITARDFTSRYEATPKLSARTEDVTSRSNFNLQAKKKILPTSKTVLPQKVKIQSEQQSSQTGKRKDANQFSKDYEKVLNSKYYRYYFRFLVLAFYIVFLVIFVHKVYNTKAFDSDMQVLEARKNGMRLVLARTAHMIELSGETTRLLGYAQGKMNESDYPTSYSSSNIKQRTGATISQLAQSNTNLMIAVDTLDSIDQALLFEKNVEIYDTTISTSQNSVLTLNTFQATERIVETSARALSLASSSLQPAIPDFNFLMRNTLNDLLSEDELIAYDLFATVNVQVQGILQRNKASLVLCSSLIASFFVLFCLVVMKQYNEATQNLQALTKLNIDEVIKTMERVITFQNMIQNDADFGEIQSTDIYESSRVRKEETKKSNEKKNKYTQNTNFKKKYWWYPMKFLALLAGIIGILVSRLFVVQDTANDLGNIVNQLYFSDRVGPRIRLTGIMMQDFLFYNTSMIRNSPLLIQYNKEVLFVLNATINLTDVNESSSYDPIINGILFGDACSYLSPTDSQISFCLQLRQGFQEAGLVKFMSGYQPLLKNFLEDYTLSNKSDQSLSALAVKWFGYSSPSMFVIVDLLSIISTQLDSIFYTKLNQGDVNNKITNGLLFPALIIVWFLVHLYVINRVKETENEFKNVLKVFPAKLVLSNFMLKSYLMRTAGQVSKTFRLLNGE